MKNIKVIIGSNFGDEGKGLMTDYFASQLINNSIVVRFNGGGQASHTVVTPDSIRHAFSHFGSGTMVGLPTYLSKYFIVNPILFKKEFNELQKKNIKPVTYVDINCLITTPFDMLVNQIIETVRDKNRHGSCGVGINETIRRNEIIPITVSDLFDKKTLLNKIYLIKDYSIQRIKNVLGDVSIPIEFVAILNNDNVIVNYLKDIDFFLNNTIELSEHNLKEFDNIIFEGAQGLLLDQNSKYFPNVTPSNTGMKNVTEIIKNIGLQKEDIEIIYVTRWYMTRHGAGKFPTEIDGKPSDNIIDLTNIPNQFQGNLRFGLLNINSLKETIDNDLCNAKELNYRYSVAVTCLDQIKDSFIQYIVDNEILLESLINLIANIDKKIKPEHLFLSYGMTRNTIKKIEGFSKYD